MPKKKILIVDDERDIRDLVKTLLTENGYEVSAAKDAKDCLEKLKFDRFDLVLLDFFMPKMSGRQLAEEIRNNPKLRALKLAFLTIAKYGKEGMKELKRLGISDYIQKPFDNNDLIRRVKKILGK